MKRIAAVNTRAARPQADDTAAIRTMQNDIAIVRAKLLRTMTSILPCEECGRHALFVTHTDAPKNGFRVQRLKCRACGSTSKLIQRWTR